MVGRISEKCLGISRKRQLFLDGAPRSADVVASALVVRRRPRNGVAQARPCRASGGSALQRAKNTGHVDSCRHGDVLFEGVLVCKPVAVMIGILVACVDVFLYLFGLRLHSFANS